MNQTQQKVNAQTPQQNGVQKLPDIGKAMINRLLEQVVAFANIENTPLTDKERSYAMGIFSGIVKTIEERKIDWNLVDMKSVMEQTKAYSRIGLSIEQQEIYIDVRNNGKTGKVDVNIKKQYQGIEKELLKWCSKKIIRYYQDIICSGDSFETEVDFETGLKRVVKHKKNPDIDRNKLENITGAYKIAYVEENGKLNQYVVEIDKNRIMRAYNASPTNEKPIWNKDTQRMVLKTAAWCLYHYVLRPFVNVPIELKKDYEVTKDKLDFDNAEEIVVEEIKNNANTGELVDIPQSDQPKQVVPQQEKEPAEEQKPQQQSLFAEQQAQTNNGKPF